MTTLIKGVILGVVKKRAEGPERKKDFRVRKGKAMLQRHSSMMKNTYRKFDLQGIIMPTAKRAEWPINVCLHKTGSSGCLEPDASPRTMK